MNEDWKRYIETKKAEYKKIGKTSCQAFNNEVVYFNKHGLAHLQWKGRVPRPRLEQKKRLDLLEDIIFTLTNQKEIEEYRFIIEGKSKVHFWELRGIATDKTFRIILRRKNNGFLHFYSVFTE